MQEGPHRQYWQYRQQQQQQQYSRIHSIFTTPLSHHTFCPCWKSWQVHHMLMSFADECNSLTEQPHQVSLCVFTWLPVILGTWLLTTIHQSTSNAGGPTTDSSKFLPLCHPKHHPTDPDNSHPLFTVPPQSPLTSALRYHHQHPVVLLEYHWHSAKMPKWAPAYCHQCTQWSPPPTMKEL